MMTRRYYENWGSRSLTSTRNFFVSTGVRLSAPRSVYCNCWVKTFRFVFPSYLQEERVRGKYSGGALSLHHKLVALMNTIIYFSLYFIIPPLPLGFVLPPPIGERDWGGGSVLCSGVFFRKRTLPRGTWLGGPVCKAELYSHCFVDSVNR